MKRLALLFLVPAILTMTGCPAVERDAYNAIVAGKAFTDSVKSKHPECTPANAATVCMALRKAVAAKDAIIDAAEVYCAGPNFNGGGACDPPAKNSAAATQAVAKIQAAIAGYNQAAADLKGLVK